MRQNLRTRPREAGFTLIEMIVVSLLLAVAMLGLLAVFDASARINKNETDVADAQGAVRYGIYQMTRVIRMAGAGGLYVTQAVLNHNDRGLPGILPAGASYDNVAGVTVADTGGTTWTVRPGTDMIEIRGVILSPLIGFDQQTGCNGCTGTQSLTVLPIVGNLLIGQHVNDDTTNRPQFAAVDAYTTAAASDPMLVIVEDGNTDLHVACSDPSPEGVTRYPQAVYNVGTISAQTQLVSARTFGSVDFGGTIGPRFNVELPSTTGLGVSAVPIQKLRRAGILDDFLFFITTDPTSDPTGIHPFLAQGVRRGNEFEVTRLAEDVEDMQVAYGVDGIITGVADNALTVQPPVPPAVNVDPNVSTVADGDEWVPNVDTETAPVDGDFQEQQPFAPAHTGAAFARHCPRLHGVMISLLAKARDSDPTYRGPAAQGYQLMNSTAVPVTPGNYRRRVQTLKVNLRNYAFQG
jgi:prepilin-type N-terminal cleavage/methylation domain-containing protein